MKLFKLFLPLSLIFIITGFTSPNNYTLYKNFEITIHGTSNLHDWNETVGKVTGDLNGSLNSDGSFDLNEVKIKMDVYSIKSESSAMDNNTYKALKADANPEIIFTLTAPVKSIKITSNESAISIKIDITIAGVTKAVIMRVKVFMPEPGKLIFQGSQLLKMTDYGIDPPTALFGALKTGDNITINFKTNFLIK